MHGGDACNRLQRMLAAHAGSSTLGTDEATSAAEASASQAAEAATLAANAAAVAVLPIRRRAVQQGQAIGHHPAPPPQSPAGSFLVPPPPAQDAGRNLWGSEGEGF